MVHDKKGLALGNTQNQMLCMSQQHHLDGVFYVISIQLSMILMEATLLDT